MPTFETIKKIADFLRKADKLEEYKQILELWEKLLEIQCKYDDLLKEDKKLKETLELCKKLKFKNNTFWDGEEGPYCPGCFGKEKLAVRMTIDPDSKFANCPVCKTRVNYTGRKDHSYGIAVRKYISSVSD